MKTFLLRALILVVLIIGLVWGLFTLLIFSYQSKLIFLPENTLHDTPASAGLTYDDVYLVTQDNLNIHGWWIQHDNPRATMLYLHGNGGNIAHRVEKLRIYHQLGLSVLVIDYRGYGLSDGSPSEQGTYHDAEAAWEFLTQTQGLPQDHIILYGESLGSGVASLLASQVRPGALIIESPFTSIIDMGKHYYPYLPIELIARVHYPVIQYIREITSPLLVIHSPEDDIVPFEMGKKIFNIANPPKEFLEISGNHNLGFFQSGQSYLDGFDKFINKHLYP